MTPTSQQQQLAAENLYRDANSMLYGDSNPSEDAIDRVVGKINKEYVYLPCRPGPVYIPRFSLGFFILYSP